MKVGNEMTKRQQQRVENLLPGGVPRWVRIYDNDGETADRYTVVFTGRYTHKTDGQHWHRGMSENPFHPQGVGLLDMSYRQIDVNKHGFAPMVGRKNHLGRRITFEDLPEKCRQCVMQDYLYLWDLPGGENHPGALDPFAPGVKMPWEQPATIDNSLGE